MDDRVHLFGIRHHGPGSAASLLEALEDLHPETVLIEGPPEADDIVTLAGAKGMRPPIAILVHAADDPSYSSFYPFAAFSPEWQAILWAIRNSRSVRFIDLPTGISVAQRMEADKAAAEELEALETDPSESDPPESDIEQIKDAQAATGEAESADAEGEEELDGDRLRGDPMYYLAKLAGYSDSEAWWNALIEQQVNAPTVFAAIEEAMTALRQSFGDRADLPEEEREREARREAYMRTQIRKTLADTEGTIAVVAGAWHVPALRAAAGVGDDKATLKGLRPAKVKATWVPWTDTRLATSSGYGAGVISPGWYRHVWSRFRDPRGRGETRQLVASWHATVATLLREEGYPASSASVIEAVRLSMSLAALRDAPVPGLQEMRDASLAALCHGDLPPLQLIEHKLIIGTRVGRIDQSVPQMPLQEDLTRWQKKLRLKPSADAQEAAVDLRTKTGLAKSTLLHRLALIDVDWGVLRQASAGRGTFREVWELEWQPELSVKLADALAYGTTIFDAAHHASLAFAEKTQSIAGLADLVNRCLLADLPEAARRVIARLQAVAVNADDIGALMAAVPPLADILRYGTARKIPQKELILLVKSMSAEVTAGLVYACRQLDDASAETYRGHIQGFQRAVTLLADEVVREEWMRALHRLADDGEAAPLVKGAAARLLYDSGGDHAEESEARLSLALSPSVPAKDAGNWLDGFLSGASQLLLYDDTLLGLIDHWLSEQETEVFVELLPVLRRALSGVDLMERRRLLDKLKDGARPESAKGATAVPQAAANPAFEAALPLLATILGAES